MKEMMNINMTILVVNMDMVKGTMEDMIPGQVLQSHVSLVSVANPEMYKLRIKLDQCFLNRLSHR